MADDEQNPPRMPTPTEQADLAADFRATTLEALHRVKIADDADTLETQIAAGAALLAAHRPAAAVRHLARARELAGERQPADLEVMSRRAEQAATMAARPRARSGTVFVQALVELWQERVRDRENITLTEDALALVNETARRLGSSHVVELVPREGWLQARLGVGHADKAARTVEQPDDGYPCERCGAPRWTFTQDDDLGEFCSSCAYPLDVEALAVTRRRRTNRELSERVAELEAQVADRDRRLADAAGRERALEAKVEKLKRPAQLLSRARGRAQVNLGGALGQPNTSSAIPADATTEQIAALAAEAAAGCQASKAVVDACAVRMRELQAQQPQEGSEG